MAKYQSTKTYGTEQGLSCCFRQWRSTHSHCSTLHGYSIGIRLVFESETLDIRNWVMDFGGLKAFKAWSQFMFDHTLIMSHDDPALSLMKELKAANPTIFDLRVTDGVGCEKFAEMAYNVMNDILQTFQTGKAWSFRHEDQEWSFAPRYQVNKDVRLVSVEVFEHGANSAIYYG